MIQHVKKRLAIIGTRGIPNRYGGFEQFITYLAPGLVREGWEVYVYCPHHHPVKSAQFEGVHLIYCHDPETYLGAAGHFLYDMFCMMDCRKQNFDIIFQLGYTTSGIWQFLWPANSKIVSNMDGLEWSRSKYRGILKRFLLWSEKQVIFHSHAVIADAIPIKTYLDEKYNCQAHFISYGADEFLSPDEKFIKSLNVKPFQYSLLIARMQPDNHIEEIIQGVIGAASEIPLLLVGNTNPKFARFLMRKYQNEKIQFLGSIFDQTLLNQLRYFSGLYFHGHSAGGTNPSLLEAMASHARICAHDNVFNRSVLGDEAYYFKDPGDISNQYKIWLSDQSWDEKCRLNIIKIKDIYQKNKIIQQHHELLLQLL